MKKIYSCLVIFPLLVCCSMDSHHGTDMTLTKDGATELAMRGLDSLPTNAHNPFDLTGLLYYEITSTHDSIGHPISTDSIILVTIEMIADDHGLFDSFKGSHYSTISVAELNPIVNDPTGSVTTIIDNSDMSNAAKSSYGNFLSDLKSACLAGVEYSTVFDYIVSYEEAVIDESTLTGQDKKIILSSTPIARYALYREKKKSKKNTDRDWDLLIARIAGGTKGIAYLSPGNAVTISAALSVIFEK